MNDLDHRWAWSQVEAMADGSLPPADEKRMRTALRADAKLRAAVERATAVRHGLRGLGRTPVSPSLWRRLLQIPRAEGRRADGRHADGHTERDLVDGRRADGHTERDRVERRRADAPRAARHAEPRRLTRVVAVPGLGLVAAALGLAAASVLAVTVFLVPEPTPDPAMADERDAAVADFAVAMTYLQRSAARAGTEMTAAVRVGLQDALTVSRNAISDEQSEPSNGD